MSGHEAGQASFSAVAQREAAEWLARRDGGLTPDEEAEFQRWLAGAVERKAAWAAVESTWAVVTAPQRRGRGHSLLRLTEMAEQRLRRQRRRRVWQVSLGMAAILVVAFAARFTSPKTNPDRAGLVSTVAVKPDRQTLPDGSSVELAEGAEIRVEFTHQARAVRMIKGEALFTVTKDPARPFVVSAAGVDVRAVGTEFSVRMAVEKVTVLVTEGKVAVAQNITAPGPAVPAQEAMPAATLVTAGSVAEVSTAAAEAPALRSVSEAELRRELAWRSHRIEFNVTPLAEAVAWVNRVNARQIMVDPSVADLRITGVFWSDDPAGFARLLEASLGLQVIEGAETIRLAPRR